MSVHTLMFGWEYPPVHCGGLGVACQGLVEGLNARGVKVTLALPHPNPAKSSHLSVVHPTDKQYEQLREEIRIASLLQPYEGDAEYQVQLEEKLQNIEKSSPKSLGQIYGNDLHEAIHVYTELSVEMTKHAQPDVVHAHDWMTYAAGERAAKHFDKPLVTHIHATELDRTHFSPNQWIYDKERAGFEAADRIIAVSSYTKGILTNHYGIKEDKIHVIHNGSFDEHDPHFIHTNNEYRKTKHAPMILFLGRLALQKGAIQFLEMAREVHKLRPDVQFVVAGDGHMQQEMIDKSIEFGLAKNIIFAGKVDSTEAKRLYQEADCFVMPSLSEPFGLVALEAIAHGTPVILSKQSGAAEVVAHSFTVNFWDTAKMADCALTILRDQPLSDQLTYEAPKILSNLTWENQAAKVHSVYHSLTS